MPRRGAILSTAREYRTDATATPQRVRRYDRDVSGLLPPVATPEGFLLVQGRFAKPGVLVYANADGTETRELVTAEVLHDPKSLGTMGRKPVTLEHPNQGEKVDAANVQRLGVGDVDGLVEVDQQGGFVVIRAAVRRADAVAAIRAGKVELSPGYDVDVDPTPGVHPEFGRYDAVQRNRVYNHLAIVDLARGGPSVCLRVDGAVQVHPGERARSPRIDSPRSRPMNPKILDLLLSLGVSRADADAVPAESAPIVAAMADAMAALKAAVADLTAKCATLEKAIADDAAADAKAGEAAAPVIAEAPPAAAAAKQDGVTEAHAIAYADKRAPLLALAKVHKVDGAKLGNADLRKAIVLAADAKAPKTESADYYRARVDSMQAPVSSLGAWNEIGAATVVQPGAHVDGADKKAKYDGLDSWTRGLLASRGDLNPSAAK